MFDFELKVLDFLETRILKDQIFLIRFKLPYYWVDLLVFEVLGHLFVEFGLQVYLPFGWLWSSVVI